MTALGWLLLGYIGGMCAGMFLAAAIARHFLLLGREERDRYRDADPDDRIGRLPSEMDDEPADLTLGRLHSAEDAAEITASLPLIAPDDSWPRQQLRSLAVRPQWPDDMPDEERLSISEGRRHDWAVDAADRGGHQ